MMKRFKLAGRRRPLRHGSLARRMAGMLPHWPKNVLRAKDGQTYRDPKAIPEKLRTKKERKDFEDGGFHEVEPITTLRRTCLGVYAEVVRIAYWIGRKAD